MIQDIGLLVLGLAILIVGGELLVRGAVGFAKSFSISPLVIGMTVVSFGTSAPELLVSVQSAVNGNPGIAIGNVVGSNIANIALVLGLTVIIFPIIPGRPTKRIDWPMMMLATILFFVFSFDGIIEFWEGLVLFLILLIFTTLLIRKSIKETAEDPIVDSEEEEKKVSFWLSWVYLLAGLGGLYFGSEWLVGGAVGIARSMEMEEHIIGLTIVAFGTSAPELVASTVAAYRKQTDISLGNLVGSNIFNIMAVIGITGMVAPVKVEEEVLHYDFWWMGGVAIGLGAMLYIGAKIGRGKGIVLFGTYILYIILLVLKAQGIAIF